MQDLYYKKDGKKYLVTCDDGRLLGILEELRSKREFPYLRSLIVNLLKFDYSVLDEIFEPNIMMEDRDLLNEVKKYQDKIVSSRSIKDKLYNTWELEYTLGKALREMEKHPSYEYYERVQNLIHLEKVPELELK